MSTAKPSETTEARFPAGELAAGRAAPSDPMADLRVFLNQADGTGSFDDFLQPTFPVNDRASPSEPADFNHDGNTDICVANINTDSVSILLGNGDGTYGPQ
ncbi:MAG: VCBS repeat-containing protein, partial [Chloroflexi bacterium]|nr:VCBS repeat-containing protein [Chloroflexota bacterium]